MTTERLVRLLKLAIMLRSGRPCTVEELGIRLGISRRSALRDLAILRSVGIVYWFDRASQAYRLEQGDPLDSLSFSEEEAVAVVLVTEHMQDISFLPNPAAAASAGLKLENVVPRRQRDRISSVLDKLRIRKAGDTNGRAQEQTLAALQEAAMIRCKIEIEYCPESGDASRRLLLHPYLLIFEGEQWHLFALDPERLQVGSYRVSRIMKVECCRSTFFEAPLALDSVR